MRYILMALAVYHGINGSFMLFASEFWYGTAPGASHTGAFNGHFVKDIGLAFLASAFALGYAGWRGISPGLIGAALVFTGGHAILHFIEMIVHGVGPGVWLTELLLIVIPGLLPIMAFWQPVRSAEVAR